MRDLSPDERKAMEEAKRTPPEGSRGFADTQGGMLARLNYERGVEAGYLAALSRVPPEQQEGLERVEAERDEAMRWLRSLIEFNDSAYHEEYEGIEDGAKAALERLDDALAARPSVQQEAERPLADCPCGEPAPAGYPPCTLDAPCPYAEGLPLSRWPSVQQPRGFLARLEHEREHSGPLQPAVAMEHPHPTEPTDEEVDAAARAISQDQKLGLDWKQYRRLARAALCAARKAGR